MIDGAVGLVIGAAVLGMVGDAVPMERAWTRRGIGLGVGLCLVGAMALVMAWAGAGR